MSANSAGTRAISYDGRGNSLGETRPGGVSVSASYDGYGRLLTYVRTGDPPQANAYNGLDERVGVTSGSTTHAFVYDPDGRLMGEYDASGAPVAETIWLSPSVASANQPIGGSDGVGGYAPLVAATGSGGSPAFGRQTLQERIAMATRCLARSPLRHGNSSELRRSCCSSFSGRRSSQLSHRWQDAGLYWFRLHIISLWEQPGSSR